MHERLVKLVEELDAFYSRDALRLGLAGRDRELLPKLNGLLTAVEAGVGGARYRGAGELGQIGPRHPSRNRADELSGLVRVQPSRTARIRPGGAEGQAS